MARLPQRNPLRQRTGVHQRQTAKLGKKKRYPPEVCQPGKPQQNGYVERYNRTVRYGWLNQYLFESLEEIQDFATKWLWSYNNERPNMGIGGITPAMKR